MSRTDLTEKQWRALEPHLPADPHRGHAFVDHRTVLNGILWRLKTGAPWRDVPARYGPWQTCYDRYVRWSRNGTWHRILKQLQAQADAAGQIDERVGAVWERTEAEMDELNKLETSKAEEIKASAATARTTAQSAIGGVSLLACAGLGFLIFIVAPGHHGLRRQSGHALRHHPGHHPAEGRRAPDQPSGLLRFPDPLAEPGPLQAAGGPGIGTGGFREA